MWNSQRYRPSRLRRLAAAVALVAVACSSLAPWVASLRAQGSTFGERFTFASSGITLRTGIGAPSSGLGNVNDLYFRSDEPIIYRKTAVGWIVASISTAPGGAGTFLRSDGSAWLASTLVLPNAIAAGGLLYGSSTNTVAALAAGASGQIPRSGGSGAPAWSTATYPDTAPVSRIMYAASANVWGTSADFTFDGARLTTPEATVSGSAPITTIDGAVLRMRAAGATRYALDLYPGYDGVTRLDAYDTTGGAWAPIVVRASTLGLDAAVTADSITVEGASTFLSYAGSTGYASQTSGWRVTPDGAGDFRYIYVDEMHAKSFIADLEQALAGGQIIAKSVAVLAATFTCPAPAGSTTLTVEDLPGAADMEVYQANDYVVVRSFSRSGGGLTIGDCVGVVTSPNTTATGTQTWTFTRGAGANSGGMTTGVHVEAGGLAIDYGVSGNGYYEVSAVDGVYGANAPYWQIVSWATSPVAANRTVRARGGKLTGITGVSNEYGIIAGDFAASDGRYFRASNEAFEIHGLDLSLWDGTTRTIRLDPATPSFAMGSPVPTSYSSGVGCWSGMDAGVFKWRCGDPSGHLISWNGSTLNVVGNIIVEGLIADDVAFVDGIAASVVASNSARAGLGLSSSGGVLLPVAAAPSGCGLFLGSDKMGHYCSSAWANYFDNAGNFYLGGTSGALTYSAGVLTITGADLNGDGAGITAINGGNITTDTITATQIAANAITTSELAADSVTSAKIVANTIVAADIAAGTITTTEIAADTITAGNIAADAITASELAADSVTSAKIVAGTILASDIAVGTITGDRIAANTITAAEIAADAITASELAADSVTSAKIEAGTIVASDIAAGAITADRLNVSSLSAITATLGSVTINDTLTMSTGQILADQYVLNNDGLLFENSADAEASVSWVGGAEINGGDARLRLRSPGGSLWSQINLNDSFIGFWGGITGSGPQHMFIDGNGVGTESGTRLGQDGYEFSELWVTVPSTTGNEYPVVWLANGSFRHKTDGVDGAGGCGLVGDITLESGIVTAVSCSTVPSEIAELRREIVELRALVASLSAGK